MSQNVNTDRRFHRPSERLTLFSICCPCLRPKKLTCRASDIALVMYDKDEPHEYVIEKLAIKRIPLRLFGVQEDFLEYERSLQIEPKTTCEKEIAVTNFEEIESVPVQGTEEEKPSENQKEFQVNKKAISQGIEARPNRFVTEETSCSSLNVNWAPSAEFPDSKLSFACEPLAESKSGAELLLRTITMNSRDDVVTEKDERIAKMSPDLEKTINVLKAVKPRPVSTQGTPMPIKNQRRLSTRNVEQEGIITKESYNYMPCPKDNPLQGINYTLNKTTLTPVVDETSKSIITDHQGQNTMDQLYETKNPLMVEEATTNYEDGSVLALPDDFSTLHPSMFTIPSTRNFSDEYDYIRSDCSSESTNFLGTSRTRRFTNNNQAPSKRRAAIGNTDFSVYNAEVSPRFGRRFAPKYTKKHNLKWKIVINNHSKEETGPSTSNSEFLLSSMMKSPSKNRIISKCSFSN